MRLTALLSLALLCLGGAIAPLSAQTSLPIRGDVNGDGQVTSLDALAILSFAVGKSVPAGYTLEPNGDNNGDGRVTAVDALIALSFVVGRNVSQFPINTVLQRVFAVELTPPSAIVLVGESAPLSATLRDSTGAAMPARPVAWSTSNPAVAAVDANGVVTATGVGIATITATADGKSGSVVIAGDQLVASTVAAGAQHSCALTTSGAARCWGSNVTAQLGDGTRTDRRTPTPVSGGLVFKSISVGEYHSCALTTAGAAYCWGQSSYGQVGDGTSIDRLTPTAVAGGRTFQALSAGRLFTVGLAADGAAFAWGVNGDGTATPRLAPFAVPGGLTFKSVSSGEMHVLAVTTSGALYAWGDNSKGQLGDSTLTKRATPVRVSSSLTYRAVSAAGTRSFAIASGGAAYGWGDNQSRLLGTDVTEPTALVPSPVVGGRSFSAISAGASHVVALTTAGSAYAWGSNGAGQLGSGIIGADMLTPTAVDGGRAYRAVSSGQGHTLAQTHDGTVYTWGFNQSGQIGDGTTLDRARPYLIPVSVPASGVSIAATPVALMYQGATATLAVTLTRRGGFTGDVFLSIEAPAGVGATLSTAVLTGTTATATVNITTGAGTPAGTHRLTIRARPDGRIDAATTSSAIGVTGSSLGHGMAVAGSGFSCGLTTAGKAFCWGAGNYGQLGDTLVAGVYSSLAPLAVQGGLTFATLAAGASHVCGLTPAGAAYCWGSNSAGQLGNGSIGSGATVNIAIPTAVVGGLTFRSITAGSLGTCAITTGGAAYCWGSGMSGQTGSPTAVPGGLTFHQISIGFAHFLGLTTAGDVYSWGGNDGGELGDGTRYTGRVAPARVAGMPAAVSVGAGGTHSVALAGSGTPYVWGTGTLGLGTIDETRLTPTPITNLSDLRAISAGNQGDVALSQMGDAWYWGRYELSSTATVDGCMNGGPCTTTFFTATTPNKVGSGIRTISGGGNHAIALRDDGVAMGVGSNGSGAIGDGTRTAKTTFSFEPQGYSVAVVSPLWLQPGTTTSTPITVTRRGGFTTKGVSFPGDIGLSVGGTLPSGVSGTITPNPLSPSQSGATLTLTTASGATPGPLTVSVQASAAGAPAQSAPLSVIVATPKPAAGYNLVCPLTAYYFGFACLTNEGKTAPFHWAIEPLHTRINGSEWWVERGSEVCVQWDATNGKTRVKFSGGSFGGAPTDKTGEWGILVKQNGDPESFAPGGWTLYTSVLDPQLKALTYFSKYGAVGSTIPSGTTPIANYNFVKGACPW